MSSFMVSDNCINTIVNAMGRDSFSVASYADHDELGKKLMRLNDDALVARYRDEPAESFDFKWKPQPSDRYQEFMAMQSWLYQCSEGNVPTDPLFKQVEELCNELACSIAMRHPRCESASWG